MVQVPFKELAQTLSASARGVSRTVDVANPLNVRAVMHNEKLCILWQEGNKHS